MPCGFVYTVLLIAAMQPGAWSGAALMLAFGLGTLPAMLIVSFGSAQWLHRVHRNALQRLSGLLLLASAMLTVASPWIELHAPGLHRWLPFMCSTS
jgi:sulfite exporter TauE/SafE